MGTPTRKLDKLEGLNHKKKKKNAWNLAFIPIRDSIISVLGKPRALIYVWHRESI